MTTFLNLIETTNFMTNSLTQLFLTRANWPKNLFWLIVSHKSSGELNVIGPA